MFILTNEALKQFADNIDEKRNAPSLAADFSAGTQAGPDQDNHNFVSSVAHSNGPATSRLQL